MPQSDRPCEVAQSQPRRLHKRKNIGRRPSPTPQKIVAIIEDDRSILRATSVLLSAFGFGTEMFESAEAFLKVAASSKAACLVVDIDLGTMTGIEMAHQLVETGSSYPIIFTTGLDSERTRRQAEHAGAVAYLNKPFPAQMLIEAIIKAIG